MCYRMPQKTLDNGPPTLELISLEINHLMRRLGRATERLNDTATSISDTLYQILEQLRTV